MEEKKFWPYNLHWRCFTVGYLKAAFGWNIHLPLHCRLYAVSKAPKIHPVHVLENICFKSIFLYIPQNTMYEPLYNGLFLSLLKKHNALSSSENFSSCRGKMKISTGHIFKPKTSGREKSAPGPGFCCSTVNFLHSGWYGAMFWI